MQLVIFAVIFAYLNSCISCANFLGRIIFYFKIKNYKKAAENLRYEVS